MFSLSQDVLHGLDTAGSPGPPRRPLVRFGNGGRSSISQIGLTDAALNNALMQFAARLTTCSPVQHDTGGGQVHIYGDSTHNEAGSEGHEYATMLVENHQNGPTTNNYHYAVHYRGGVLIDARPNQPLRPGVFWVRIPAEFFVNVTFDAVSTYATTSTVCGTITGCSTLVVDFSGAVSLKIPASAAPTISANGHIGIDTTITDLSHGALDFWAGEHLRALSMPVAEFTGLTNGEVPIYNSTADEFQMGVPTAVIADGDYGDITVSGSGTIFTIDADTVDTNELVNNGVTDAILRDSAALSVIGRSANSSGDPADIAAGSDGHILRRSGTSLGFGQIVAAGITDATITYAKIQSVTAARLLGRQSGSAGDVQEITPGTNLGLSGTTLSFTPSVSAGVPFVISSGAFNKGSAIISSVAVDTESAGATDDLDSISGGTEGDIITIRPYDDGRTVVVKHATSNIYLRGGADITLDNDWKSVTLVYTGSRWIGV